MGEKEFQTPEGTAAAGTERLAITATEVLESMTQAFNEAIERIAQACREILERIVEASRKIARAITPTFHRTWDALLRSANDNPKWWHLYKYAKKARTRNKYRRKLQRQLLSKLIVAEV